MRLLLKLCWETKPGWRVGQTSEPWFHHRAVVVAGYGSFFQDSRQGVFPVPSLLASELSLSCGSYLLFIFFHTSVLCWFPSRLIVLREEFLEYIYRYSCSLKKGISNPQDREKNPYWGHGEMWPFKALEKMSHNYPGGDVSLSGCSSHHRNLVHISLSSISPQFISSIQFSNDPGCCLLCGHFPMTSTSLLVVTQQNWRVQNLLIFSLHMSVPLAPGQIWVAILTLFSFSPNGNIISIQIFFSCFWLGFLCFFFFF